jgi:hypothetical protein
VTVKRVRVQKMKQLNLELNFCKQELVARQHSRLSRKTTGVGTEPLAWPGPCWWLPGRASVAQESTFLLIKTEQQVSNPSTFSSSEVLTGISRWSFSFSYTYSGSSGEEREKDYMAACFTDPRCRELIQFLCQTFSPI